MPEHTNDTEGDRHDDGDERHASLGDSVLTSLFPPAYFSIDEKIKVPKAPRAWMIRGVLFSLAVALAAFALLYYYFSGLSFTESLISDTPLEGYTCTNLRPRVGVVYLSSKTSENAQFASASWSYDECVKNLTAADVCGDKNRYDVVGLSGVPLVESLFTPNDIFPGGEMVFTTNSDGSKYGTVTLPQLTHGVSDSKFPRNPGLPPKSSNIEFLNGSPFSSTYLLSSDGSDLVRLGSPSVYGPSDQVYFHDEAMGVFFREEFKDKPSRTWIFSGYIDVVGSNVSDSFLAARFSERGFYVNISGIISANEWDMVPLCIHAGILYAVSSPDASTKARDYFSYDLNTLSKPPLKWGFSADAVARGYGDASLEKRVARMDLFSSTKRIYIAYINGTGDGLVLDALDTVTNTRAAGINMPKKPSLPSGYVPKLLSNIINHLLFMHTYDTNGANFQDPSLLRVNFITGNVSVFHQFETKNASNVIDSKYVDSFSVFPQPSFVNGSVASGGTKILILLQGRSNEFVQACYFSPSNETLDCKTASSTSDAFSSMLTHYFMWSYSWGFCNGKIIRGIVDVTTSSSFTNLCGEGNGVYYQGPNAWTNAGACRFLRPQEFKKSCPIYASRLSTLVASTCPQSITKVCKLSTQENPPLTCSRYVRLPPLTIIANSVANVNALWAILAVIVTALFARFSPIKASEVAATKVYPFEVVEKDEGGAVEVVVAAPAPAPEEVEGGGEIGTARASNGGKEATDCTVKDENDENKDKGEQLDAKKADAESVASLEAPVLASPLAKFVTSILPSTYFKLDDRVRTPKAPHEVLLSSVAVELGLIVIAFALLFNYFYGLTYLTTVVSNTLLGSDYNCSVLIPRSSVGYLSSTSSENVQLSGSKMDYAQCMQYVEAQNPCDATRLDHIAVVGLSGKTSTYLLDSVGNTRSTTSNDGMLWTTFLQKINKDASVLLRDHNGITALIPSSLFKSFGYTFSKPDVPIPTAPTTGSNGAAIIRASSYIDLAEWQHRFWTWATGARVESVFFDDTAAKAFALSCGNNGNLFMTLSMKDGAITTTSNDLAHTEAICSASFHVQVLAVNDEIVYGLDDATTTLFSIDLKSPSLPKTIWTATAGAQFLQAFSTANDNDKAAGFDTDSKLLYLCYLDTSANQLYADVFSSLSFQSTLSNPLTIPLPSQASSSTNYKILSSAKYYQLPLVMSGGSVFVFFEDLKALAIADINAAKMTFVNLPQLNLLLNGNFVYVHHYPTTSKYLLEAQACEFGEYSMLTLCLIDSSSFSVDCDLETSVITNYMVSFAYGVCNGKSVTTMVEATPNSDFSILCGEKDGFYYQSPNEWHDVPIECAWMQPAEFSTKCPAYKEALTQLVQTQCKASIDKVCSASFSLNPPFSCVARLHYPILTVLANTLSNTSVLWGALSAAVAFVLSQIHKAGKNGGASSNNDKKYSVKESDENSEKEKAPSGVEEVAAEAEEAAVDKADEEVGPAGVAQTATDMAEHIKVKPQPKAEVQAQDLPKAGIVETAINAVIPPTYFSTDPVVLQPKAPHEVLITSATASLGVTVLAFALLLWYFSTVAAVNETKVTSSYITGEAVCTDSFVVKCDSWVCDVLHPKVGATFLSPNTSENMQFTGSYKRFDECVQLLEGELDVCGTNNFNISVGITGPTVSTDNLNKIDAICSDGSIVAGLNWAYADTVLRNSRLYDAAVFPLPVPSVEIGHKLGGVFLAAGATSDFSAYGASCIFGDELFVDPMHCTSQFYCVSAGSVSVVDFTSTKTTFTYTNMPANKFVLGIYNRFLYGVDLTLTQIFDFDLSDAAASPTYWVGVDPQSVVSSFSAPFINKYRFGYFGWFEPSSDWLLLFPDSSSSIRFDPLTRQEATALRLAAYTPAPNFATVSTSLQPAAFKPLLDIGIISPDKELYHPQSKRALYFFINQCTLRNDYCTSTLPVETYVCWYDITTNSADCSPDVAYAVQAMVGFGWGVCGGKLIRDFSPVTASGSDLTAICSQADGFYYQSPTSWIDVPPECRFVLSRPAFASGQCAQYSAVIETLIDETCPASIRSVCAASTKNNPPFQCNRKKYNNIISSFANTFANTNLVWGTAGTIVATVLASVYKGYADKLFLLHSTSQGQH